MANKDRGEVVLQAGGTTHTIRFTVNSLCNLEDELQMPITEIGNKLSNSKQVKLGLLRTILRHGFVQPTTIEEAGEIIGKAGLPAVLTAIAAGIAQAFPEAEAKAADEDPK